MSLWWDDDAKKYRSSLIAKLAYGQWTWPVWRWFVHKLPGDVVEDLKIPMIRFVGTVDKIWQRAVVVPVAIALLLIVRLLLPR
jgi:hypothetical protein